MQFANVHNFFSPYSPGPEEKDKEYLWHVQSRLSDGELEDGAGSLNVSQDRLQLGELDPGGAVLRTELQVFLVQFPAAVELTQLQLQLDVALQQFVLRAFTDRCALKRSRDDRWKSQIQLD